MSATPSSSPTETLAGLARRALAGWGLDSAEMWLLKHRENTVFGVRDNADREQWVLRVHRPGYHSDRAIRSELEWMRALREAGIPVPVPVPARNGELVAHVSFQGVAQPRQCDLLTWIEGTPIGCIENGAAAAAEDVEHDHCQAGRLSAAVHNQAQAWKPAADFERPRMDADGLAGESAYLGHYRNLPSLHRAEIELLDRACTRLRAALRAFGYGADRFGLVHGDFLPENLLRDGDVVRLIDFDDCGYGWHLMDMATSLFFLLGTPAYEAALRGFVTGYRSLRPLPDTHLEMLSCFLLARGITYLGWCATRQETAEAKVLGPTVSAAVLELAARYLEDR